MKIPDRTKVCSARPRLPKVRAICVATVHPRGCAPWAPAGKEHPLRVFTFPARLKSNTVTLDRFPDTQGRRSFILLKRRSITMKKTREKLEKEYAQGQGQAGVVPAPVAKPWRASSRRPMTDEPSLTMVCLFSGIFSSLIQILPHKSRQGFISLRIIDIEKPFLLERALIYRKFF